MAWKILQLATHRSSRAKPPRTVGPVRQVVAAPAQPPCPRLAAFFLLLFRLPTLPVSNALTHRLREPELSFPQQRRPRPEGGLRLGGNTSGVNQLYSSLGWAGRPGRTSTDILPSSSPLPPPRRRAPRMAERDPCSGKSHLSCPSFGERAFPFVSSPQCPYRRRVVRLKYSASIGAP